MNHVPAASHEPAPDWVPRRRIDVHEFLRMAEAGILRREDRVELIEGEIVEMAPIGVPHVNCINQLNRLLVLGLGDRALVSIQNPVRLTQATQPQPDVAVIRPASETYASSPPQRQDVFLLIEVADTSLRYDTTVKARLYARHGVPEYWVVDLEAAAVLVHREPAPSGYAQLRTAQRGEVLEPILLPGLRVAVAEVVG